MSDDDHKISPNNSAAVNAIPNSENMNNVNIENNQFKIRHAMVAKAVAFLLSEVKNSSMDRKINFLQNKGLTDTEIELAIQMSMNQNIQNPILPQQPVCLNTPNAIQAPLISRKSYQFIGSVTCVVLGLYFGYHVFKNYIQKWLFGVQKSPFEKRLKEVEALVQRCLILLEGRNNMSEISNAEANHQKQLEQIHAELKSVKGLIVNKSQFPPAPKTSSMPKWLNSKKTKPQVYQQNKMIVNGTSTPNESQLNTFNEQNNDSLVVHGDIVDKNNTSMDDSKSNEFESSMCCEDNVIKSEVVVVDNDVNGDSENKNN